MQPLFRYMPVWSQSPRSLSELTSPLEDGSPWTSMKKVRRDQLVQPLFSQSKEFWMCVRRGNCWEFTLSRLKFQESKWTGLCLRVKGSVWPWILIYRERHVGAPVATKNERWKRLVHRFPWSFYRFSVFEIPGSDMLLVQKCVLQQSLATKARAQGA